MINLNGLLLAPTTRIPATQIILWRDLDSLNIDGIRIANFLQARQEKGDLPQAKFFIKNLEKLKAAVNPDRTNIIGVERIFKNAEERISKNENVSGHYFEAILGIAFVNAGFKIKEISAKKSLEVQNGQAYIKRREVDFVVIKDGIKYYIEAKAHIGRVIESDEKNKQTEFLVKIANRYNAVPVIVLNSVEATFTEDFELEDLMSKDFDDHDKRQIRRYLRNYPQLQFWRVPENRYQKAEDLNIVKRRQADLNRRIEVLQTSALPLGYAAMIEN